MVLTVLVGIPGAGKSTWAASHGERAVVVSLDDIRAEDSPNFGQRAEAQRHEVHRALRSGHDVIVDACHLSAGRRAMWRRLASMTRTTTRLVLIDTPTGEARARNAQRHDDAVPEHRMTVYEDRWPAARAAALAEPWDDVLIVTT